MTARDDLCSIASSDMPVTGDEVNEAIDAFAHELAQQQRALADANDELDHDHHVYGFSEAVRQAADLIDPKAQRAATTGDNT